MTSLTPSVFNCGHNVTYFTDLLGEVNVWLLGSTYGILSVQVENRIERNRIDVLTHLFENYGCF